MRRIKRQRKLLNPLKILTEVSKICASLDELNSNVKQIKFPNIQQLQRQQQIQQKQLQQLQEQQQQLQEQQEQQKQQEKTIDELNIKLQFTTQNYNKLLSEALGTSIEFERLEKENTELEDDYDNLQKDYRDLETKYKRLWNMIPPDMKDFL